MLIKGYSLELHHGKDFLGDTVSRAAYRDMLTRWRGVFAQIHGKDPLGKKATEDISKRELDELLAQGGPAAAAIYSACEDYATQLAHVVCRFLKNKSWRGVERVVVGGGFKQSAVGELAVRRCAELLFFRGVDVQLRPLRLHSDEGGLIGWTQLVSPRLLKQYQGLLAVDIGGTNVRCGIVRAKPEEHPDLPDFDVLGRDKWGHAEDKSATQRKHLVKGIADMLNKLIDHAKHEKIDLAPFVGVSCPGSIRPDGTIAKGAQNLPGDWESSHFHFSEHLAKHLPKIDGQAPQILMHNDAVVQGLAELPFMKDVKKWAVLTVGTGLGNASFRNR